MFFSKYFSAVLAFVSLFFFGGALVALADVTSTGAGMTDIPYTPLAKLPLGKEGALLDTYTISTYLSGMFKLIIALGAAFAVLMGITGGIQYVASGISPSARSGAKERITNAIIGLVIVLTSYLILNTIDPKLVAFNFQLPPIEGTRAVVAPEVVGKSIFLQSSNNCERVCGPGSTCMSFTNETGVTVSECQPTPPTACVRPQTGTAWPSDAYERGVLGKMNINVNKANCTTIGQSDCSSVCGLEPGVMNALGELKVRCEEKMKAHCPIYVSGATEYWLHKSHGDNRKVDLGMNVKTPTPFDKYVRSSIPLGNVKGCGLQNVPHWAIGSTIFADEGNHWHACF